MAFILARVCTGHEINGKKGFYFGRKRYFGLNKGIFYPYARQVGADVHFFQGRQQNKYIKFRYSSNVRENIEDSGKNDRYLR
ncbi:hypothetical protein BK140_22055 [Paenibacillus macerans]|nr:hypothetical protein BK140_22055 [Paenibacillus macerans]